MVKTGLNKFFSEQIEEKLQEKVLFFDGHNLAYRNFYIASFEFENQRKQYLMGNVEKEYTIDMMYNYWNHLMFNSIFNAVKNYQPTKLVLAFDTRRSWRKEVYQEYKANRKKAREESDIDFELFYSKVDQFVGVFKSLFPNVYTIQIDRCEADDVIAVLTKYFSNSPLTSKIVIISSDSDLIQLQKYKQVEQFDPMQKKVIQNINPQKHLQIKILSGDQSDNIPGIKSRVGPKTAEKLLNSGLEEILKDDVIKENFIRNTRLIDFDKIPDEIEYMILNYYENQKQYAERESIDGFKVWNYLIAGKLNKLSEDWQVYSTFMKRLS